jgi:acyl-CoA thioester hydrolase
MALTTSMGMFVILNVATNNLLNSVKRRTMPVLPPEGFRHRTTLDVRFGDIDSLGHVNNAKYLTYMEQGRILYFRDLGLWTGDKTELGAIMARAVVDFKLPLTMGDSIAVYTRTSRLGSKSFDTEYVIQRENGKQAEVAATGTVVIVAFDYKANQTVLIPDEWRQKFLAYEPALKG